MDCPKCKSSHHVKDGIVQSKQRYKCKECHYRYTVERKSNVKTSEVRRLALVLYLEGFSFRFIGSVLKISYGTVYVWVKEWGSQISLPRREKPSDIVDLDNMQTCVASKQSAISYGLLLIDLEKGISVLSADFSSKT